MQGLSHWAITAADFCCTPRTWHALLSGACSHGPQVAPPPATAFLFLSFYEQRRCRAEGGNLTGMAQGVREGGGFWNFSPSKHLQGPAAANWALNRAQ